MKNFIFCAMQSKRLQLRRLRKLQLRRKSSIPFIICITSLLVKTLFSTVLKSANFMVSLFCTIFKYRMIITFLFLTFEHERLFENQLSVNRSSMKISQRNNIFNNGFNNFNAIHCSKNEVSFKDFFGKCDQICRKLRIQSHLQKKSLRENFIFCAVILTIFSISEDFKVCTTVPFKEILCYIEASHLTFT